MSDPHPAVASSSRPDRPPARPPGTVATRRSDRRAAFDNYARADADRIPSGCVVLALADLRAFDDDVDHELVGRLVAAETRADPAGVSFERFVTIADVVEARRAVPGGLGRADAGAMAPPAPEYLRSEPLRALFLARADEHQLLSASAWIQLARDARLVDDEDEGDDGEHEAARASRASNASKASKAAKSKASSRATHRAGSLTAAGASVIFARARGPSAERDAALAFSPDFLAALGWAAGARGTAFGAAASSALSSSSAPVPIAPSLQTLTAADFGASVGHVDVLDETFKHDLLAERDGGVGPRDETEPTGTATSSYSSGASRATRRSRGAPRAVSSSRESASIQILRAAFRCADLDHRGYVPVDALAALLGAAGAFDHLDLNAAAIFLASRLASLDRERGNLTHVHEREDELTLADCARHLRAALRHAAPASTRMRTTTKTTTKTNTKTEETSPSPRDRDGSRSSRAAIRLPVPVARDATRDDVDALRRVFERFCAARDEAGIDAPAHPTMMDASRWHLFARRAALFDAGFEVGAERVAFARACPPGNFRVGFDGFLVALGFVAAQKGVDAAGVAEIAKRAKTSLGPPRAPAEFARGKKEATSDASASASGSGSGSDDDTTARSTVRSPRRSPLRSPARCRSPSAPPVTKRRPKPPGRLDVANPRAAREVLAAAAPITSSALTRVLADVGALEGVHPASAGAAIAGAKMALDVDADDAAVVSVDDASRLVAALATLRDRPGTARRLDPPPARTLRAYEDHDLLRRRFNEFATFGASPRDAERLTRRLDAAWQRSLVDADAATRFDRGEDPMFGPERHARGNPLVSAPPCDKNHAARIERTPFVEDLRVTCDPTSTEGRDYPDAAQLLGRAAELSSTGPDTRAIGFSSAYAAPAAFVARRTARAFGADDAETAASSRGAASVGFVAAAAAGGFAVGSARASAVSRSMGLAGPNEGRWEAIHGVDGEPLGAAESLAAERRAAMVSSSSAAAEARASASRARADAERREAARSRMTPEERVEDDVMHRGSTARKTAALRASEEAGRAGVEAHASRLVAPDRRAGASAANFRKWFSESGLLCDALTPASLDVLHATSRAPGSGDEVTWGEFLRAVARAAELLDAPFGAVASALIAVGPPRRRYLPTPRQTSAATGATAAANAAREDVRMIRPWEESLRREMRDGRGETLGIDAGSTTTLGTMTGTTTRAPDAATRVPGGAVATAATIARARRAHDREPARLKPGSLRRVGSHVPTIVDEDGGRAPFSVAAYVESCERSHRAVVARLERAERDAERAADLARMTRGVEHHEECRAALERSTAAMNARDTWHFAKETRALRRFGAGDARATAARATRPVEDSRAADAKARELELTWLADTARLGASDESDENRRPGGYELPYGVTAADATALARTSPAAPKAPARAFESENDRWKLDVMTRGRVGTRMTLGGRAIAEGMLDAEGAPVPMADAEFGAAIAVPAVSAAALRRTTGRRVDPMASLVRSLRESAFYDAPGSARANEVGEGHAASD